VSASDLTANQIEFLNLVVDYLTEHGILEPKALYESPFTDVSPTGIDNLFSGDIVDGIMAFLRKVKQTALAA
jgi:type I restriction enzyme R subunit